MTETPYILALLAALTASGWVCALEYYLAWRHEVQLRERAELDSLRHLRDRDALAVSGAVIELWETRRG